MTCHFSRVIKINGGKDCLILTNGLLIVKNHTVVQTNWL